MAVPKKKVSRKKRNQRWHGRLARKGTGLRLLNLAVDQTTGELKLSHHMAPKSCYYNKRKVIEVKVVKVVEVKNK